MESRFATTSIAEKKFVKDAASESEAKESELETPRGQQKAKKFVWEEDASF